EEEPAEIIKVAGLTRPVRGKKGRFASEPIVVVGTPWNVRVAVREHLKEGAERFDARAEPGQEQPLMEGELHLIRIADLLKVERFPELELVGLAAVEPRALRNHSFHTS